MELDGLVPELYNELRRMAHRQLQSEKSGHTLVTTALVHEAYLKLAKLDRIEWRNRPQFMAEAARAMRRILIDYAVQRRAQKRGGNQVQVELTDAMVMSQEDATQLLALHDALTTLAEERPGHARVVECRFFAGMTVPEIADALDMSPATVKRHWRLARAWLNREMSEVPADTER